MIKISKQKTVSITVLLTLILISASATLLPNVHGIESTSESQFQPQSAYTFFPSSNAQQQALSILDTTCQRTLQG